MNTVDEGIQKHNRTDRLTVRLTEFQVESIEFLVNAGYYSTKVDFVRKAIDKAIPKAVEEAYDQRKTRERLAELKLLEKEDRQNRKIEEPFLRR